MIDVIGQIVHGGFGEIFVRQKSSEPLEIGELLVAEANEKHVLQVFDLQYGSQIPLERLELASGLQLEGLAANSEFLEKELRNYVLAKVKSLVVIREGQAVQPKTLPTFFEGLRRVRKEDLAFLERPQNPLFIGQVRSGSKALDVPVNLEGRQVLSHHVLIPATTGRGKSTLVKVMLWHLVPHDYAGVLVLDPHNEYFQALRKHPQQDKLVFYSVSPEAGAVTLRFNLSVVKPWHFDGVMPFTDAQREAMYVYHKAFGSEWIAAVRDGRKDADGKTSKVFEGTLSVLQRRLDIALDERVFVESGSETTASAVVNAVLAGKKVVADTSRLANESELLVGSVLAHELFSACKRNRDARRPVAAIVLEEAPRVLSEQAGPNVFASIAREGRKFDLGLIAVTQLASMIPREVLANLNTKIILGNEMAAERDAIISSASQDLSADSKAIAALEKGEAIISSVFTKFALPVMIPKFEDVAAQAQGEIPKRKYVG